MDILYTKMTPLKDAPNRELGKGIDAEGLTRAMLTTTCTASYRCVYFAESPKGHFMTTHLHVAVEYIEKFLGLEYVHTDIE